jgi:hypothetical protein
VLFIGRSTKTKVQHEQQCVATASYAPSRMIRHWTHTGILGVPSTKPTARNISRIRLTGLSKRSVPPFFLDIEMRITNLNVIKGTLLPLDKEFPMQMRHTFGRNRKTLICKEELYVSDQRHESHYRKGHVMNKGENLSNLQTLDSA